MFNFIKKLLLKFRKKKPITDTVTSKIYDGTCDVEVTASGAYQASDYTCLSYSINSKKTDK